MESYGGDDQKPAKSVVTAICLPVTCFFHLMPHGLSLSLSPRLLPCILGCRYFSFAARGPGLQSSPLPSSVVSCPLGLWIPSLQPCGLHSLERPGLMPIGDRPLGSPAPAAWSDTWYQLVLDVSAALLVRLSLPPGRAEGSLLVFVGSTLPSCHRSWQLHR